MERRGYIKLACCCGNVLSRCAAVPLFRTVRRPCRCSNPAPPRPQLAPVIQLQDRSPDAQKRLALGLPVKTDLEKAGDSRWV